MIDHLLDPSTVNCTSKYLQEDALLLEKLRTHPRRVVQAEHAELFLVPILFFDSHRCDTPNHELRMETFFQALKNEYWFQRHYGHDHLILAFHWLISPWSPEIGDIVPMKYRKLLENFTSTRFEKYGITEWFGSMPL